MGRGEGQGSGVAPGASQRGTRAESRATARDPDALYEVRDDEVDSSYADVNWGYWGTRSDLDVVRWTTGRSLPKEDARRLFDLGEEVCSAVADYTARVRPGDTAGVKEYGLSHLLGPMGSGHELRLRAEALADGSFVISNYDVADDWQAIVAPAPVS